MIQIVCKVGAYIAAVAMLFNVIITIVYIITRVMGNALLGTEEMVAMGQVILIAFALGYTQFTGGLVHIGFFMKKLPGRSPMFVWTLEAWIATVVCILWSYQCFVRYPFIRETSLILTLPFKPFYLLMTIGVVLYTIAQLFEAVKCTVGLFNKEIRAEIQSQWPA